MKNNNYSQSNDINRVRYIQQQFRNYLRKKKQNNEKKIAKEYYYNISGLRNNRPYCVEDLENNVETHYQNFIDDEDTYEPVFSIVKCVGKLPEKFFE